MHECLSACICVRRQYMSVVCRCQWSGDCFRCEARVRKGGFHRRLTEPGSLSYGATGKPVAEPLATGGEALAQGGVEEAYLGSYVCMDVWMDVCMYVYMLVPWYACTLVCL